MSVVGVGIDVVEIDRARRILDRHGERALARFLLPDERNYVVSMADPAAHFAVRVAAKEAAYKALQSLDGMRAVSWHDLEVVRDGEGAAAPPAARPGGGARPGTHAASLAHAHAPGGECGGGALPRVISGREGDP